MSKLEDWLNQRYENEQKMESVISSRVEMSNDKLIADLKQENKQLKEEVERLRLNEQLAINNGKLWLNENAKLKKEYSDNLSLKDEELMCLETEFNTYKSEAKDHIKKLLDCLKQDTSDPQTNYYVCQYMDKADQFIKEIEK